MCLAGAEEEIRLAPIADDNPARRKIDRIDLMVFKYVDYKHKKENGLLRAP